MINKKILTTIGVLFLSAIAATSGTFAWFFSVRDASIQYEGARIYTTDGDLKVEYKSSLNNIGSTEIKQEENVNVLTIASKQNVTDISGDGLSFYKVNWSSIDDVATNIEEIDTSDADGYFVDFTVTVSRAVGKAGFKVFLGADTAILPVDSGNTLDNGIVKAIRMVVINYDESGDPVVVIRHGVDNEAAPKYLVEGTADDAYSSGTHSFVSDLIADGGLYESASFSTESTIANAEAVYPAIADLTAEDDLSADVTFRFFIEGTDPDAKTDYLKGKFKVDLDLYSLYS